ncbi:putative steroid binding protein [Thermochaetoides thermophila DSM 1495]|uniref:5-hydroxyisourate hydrolase n=1 Tax=Chaetomium thermophilum (strain DSM 1495 / CBS 144.50 / IMI 039719) TaxID=759272 RepID=G0SFD3_CHATD|nr:putative steroid binding protein [Thermochaetoides thermophila DSM 1495]EGS18149.1 putative steroid binding protein [Thermochaetoides thermophila DSM 1495]
MAEAKDRITCHVLDTTTGQPARNLRVQLHLSSPSANATPTPGPVIFESHTDDDGRIKTWLPYSGVNSSGDVPVYTLDDVLGGLENAPGGQNEMSQWTLKFDVAGYFGGLDKTFYPEVAVTFVVRKGQRYHVPLLLAPFGYTTYRGS